MNDSMDDSMAEVVKFVGDWVLAQVHVFKAKELRNLIFLYARSNFLWLLLSKASNAICRSKNADILLIRVHKNTHAWQAPIKG